MIQPSCGSLCPFLFPPSLCPSSPPFFSLSFSLPSLSSFSFSGKLARRCFNAFQWNAVLVCFSSQISQNLRCLTPETSCPLFNRMNRKDFDLIVVHQVHRSFHPVGSCWSPCWSILLSLFLGTRRTSPAFFASSAPAACYWCGSCPPARLPTAQSPHGDIMVTSWWHHGDIVVTSWHGSNRPPWLVMVSPLYWEVPQACSVISIFSCWVLWVPWSPRSQLVDSSDDVRAFSAALWQGLATWHLSAYPFLEEWQPSVLSNCTSCPCRIAVNGTRSAGWLSCFICFMVSWSISPYFTNAMSCNLKRRGFLWCGLLWMTLDPGKSRENIAQILLESFLGSFTFGIAASNSILLKKWSFTMWQAWQHGI